MKALSHKVSIRQSKRKLIRSGKLCKFVMLFRGWGIPSANSYTNTSTKGVANECQYHETASPTQFLLSRRLSTPITF